jgi:hypothetical protein
MYRTDSFRGQAHGLQNVCRLCLPDMCRTFTAHFTANHTSCRMC